MSKINNYINDGNNREYREKVVLYFGVSPEDASLLGIIDDQIWGLILECQYHDYQIRGVYSDFGNFTDYKGYEDMLHNLDDADKILVLNPDVLKVIPDDILKELNKSIRIECVESFSRVKEIDDAFNSLTETPEFQDFIKDLFKKNVDDTYNFVEHLINVKN